MANYDFCGLSLGTDLHFPELATSACGRSDLTVVCVEGDPGETDRLATGAWLHEWSVGSSAGLSVGRIEDDYLIQFAGGSQFVYAPGERLIQMVGEPSATKRTQILNQVLPRVLDHEGRFIAHGSAIATDDGAIAFIGESGWGKSTLAACFSAMGHKLLSDDCMEFSVVDGQAWCRPTYQSLRLWPDSVKAVMSGHESERISEERLKERFQPPSPVASQPIPLTAVCILDHPADAPETVEFSDRSASQSVAALLAQNFRLDPTDTIAAERSFNAAASVVETVPTFTMKHPRDYTALPAVCEAVLSYAVTASKR